MILDVGATCKRIVKHMWNSLSDLTLPCNVKELFLNVVKEINIHGFFLK